MSEHAEPSAAREAAPRRAGARRRAGLRRAGPRPDEPRPDEPPRQAEPRPAEPSRGAEVSAGAEVPRGAEPLRRAAPSRRAQRRAKPPHGAQLPYLFVLAVAIGALAWMWPGGIQRAKEGTLALAGAMFIGALARTVLPEARAGMLASRRRLVDVVSLAALGIGLLVVALVLPTPP